MPLTPATATLLVGGAQTGLNFLGNLFDDSEEERLKREEALRRAELAQRGEQFNQEMAFGREKFEKDSAFKGLDALSNSMVQAANLGKRYKFRNAVYSALGGK
jgi:hypothetical protein